ncbi:MAG TPA: hypothetical protein VGQ12_17725 [Candidatus Angelobacter sp.]|jgi:hypothetical protein|nr:hypothetical protein [Candidatus Angelobacter sp.]
MILSDDAVSADATCSHLMGFIPDRVIHIHEAARFLGNLDGSRIDQVGENVNSPEIPFDVVPEFRFLQTNARGPLDSTGTLMQQTSEHAGQDVSYWSCFCR